LALVNPALLYVALGVVVPVSKNEALAAA